MNESVIQSGIERLLRSDAELVVAIARFEARGLRAVMRALTRAGDTAGWIVHGLVLFLLLDLEAHAVETMTLAAALATTGSQLAKRWFRRSRPTAAIPGFTAHTPDPDPFSFPSGHATMAFAIATSAVATNPVLGGVETVLAASIAASRVGLGAHYPVDVVGGMALGFACGLGAWLIVV